MDSRFCGNDIENVKDKVKGNQEKQSKLTDAYLENLLGIDVYRDKITVLRNEEENLKKLIAGYELKKIERKRSEVKEKPKCQINKVLAKIAPKKSTSEHSDGRWPSYSKSMMSLAAALVE